MKKYFSLPVDLVFPRRCPVCDEPVRPFGAKICTDCEKKLKPIEGSTCCRCGKVLCDAEGEYCRDCRNTEHSYERGGAVFSYRDCAGSLYRFKYKNRREYAKWYGEQLSSRLTQVFPGEHFDLVLPVPLYPEKERKRGYNQAWFLAKELSRNVGIPTKKDALIRVKNTLPMKNMGISDRQNNLKRAFHACANDVKLKAIIVIDDIYTTGTTIDACAQALYRAGADRVCFLTLAIGADRPEKVYAE